MHDGMSLVLVQSWIFTDMHTGAPLSVNASGAGPVMDVQRHADRCSPVSVFLRPALT